MRIISIFSSHSQMKNSFKWHVAREQTSVCNYQWLQWSTFHSFLLKFNIKSKKEKKKTTTQTLSLCVSLPAYTVCKRSLMYYCHNTKSNWSVFLCTSCWLELHLERQEVKLSPKSIWLQPRTWTPSGLLGQASLSFYCSVNSIYSETRWPIIQTSFYCLITSTPGPI